MWRVVIAGVVCAPLLALQTACSAPLPECGKVEQLSTIPEKPSNVTVPLYASIVKPHSGVQLINIRHEQKRINLGYPAGMPGNLEMMLPAGTYTMSGTTEDGKDCESRFKINK